MKQLLDRIEQNLHALDDLRQGDALEQSMAYVLEEYMGGWLTRVQAEERIRDLGGNVDG